MNATDVDDSDDSLRISITSAPAQGTLTLESGELIATLPFELARASDELKFSLAGVQIVLDATIPAGAHVLQSKSLGRGARPKGRAQCRHARAAQHR
eukprot:7379720-Prymnesium_polylepis.1